MAGRAQDDLVCTVCLDIFRDPVSLGCNHSFCSTCLKDFWDRAQNTNCPICKRKSSKEFTFVDFALKERSHTFLAGSTGSPWSKKDEKTEDPLKSGLKSLQDRREKYKQVREKYDKMVEHSKKQLLSTERQIRAEFNKLHKFLKEEEESRLAALREEEEQKSKTLSREMKMIEKQIACLSDGISAAEEELEIRYSPFMSYKTIRVCGQLQSSVLDPQLVSGALIDVAKHLGNLTFTVWEKMKEKVPFSPVILDPNTAAPWLYLSDDLTSVRNGDIGQQLPDNPERQTKYPIVLGSEGFSSGEHSWEVEVGDHPNWTIGLAKKLVDRKGERVASPRYGLWCLTHDDGKYTNGVGQTVTMKKSLKRIRVQLDYDWGDVSFYHPGDMTPICTHRDTFTEKLFPYFNIGNAGDDKTADIKICRVDFPHRKNVNAWNLLSACTIN